MALEEKRIALQEGLPHLYGWKWYKWARAFFESINFFNLLTAANQVSKSSTQIRKCIHWATETSLWPSLWRTKPTQFWYFYPTAPLATAEFETKWQEFLPRGKYKDDPKYGWRAQYKNKEIHAIYFNSGLIVYFHSYQQDLMALQAGSVNAMFCDEEMPSHMYDELTFRLAAVDGYFHMVFTATLGQDLWRLAMDPGPAEKENLPKAFKQTISMFDCMFYEDDTQSHWTPEKIQRVIDSCQTENEVLRRVYGKFIKDAGGLKYPQFNIKRHMKEHHQIPKNWGIYAAVDCGSGGEENHPSAIIFIGVNPEMTQGRAFLGWRGDGIRTTAGDTVEKFIALKREHKIITTRQVYDWGSRDFYEIASRNGEGFEKAEKSHEKGEEIVNTLFKYNMLAIYETDELHKLSIELMNLKKDTPKNKAKDDLADTLRYACASIPWDFSIIANAQVSDSPKEPKFENDTQRQVYERRKDFEQEHKDEVQRVEEEISEWNEAYEL